MKFHVALPCFQMDSHVPEEWLSVHAESILKKNSRMGASLFAPHEVT